MITLEQIGWVLAPRPRHTRIADIYPHLWSECETFEIDSPLRQAHFLAQTAWETDRFCALEEYASGDAYDTRTDLGNTAAVDGDGRLFKGRGLMMLTGKRNYRLFSQFYYGDDTAVKDPYLLADDVQAAVASACWFWAENDLNRLADADDIVKLTRKINGGRNGLEGRRQLFERAAYAFGLDS